MKLEETSDKNPPLALLRGGYLAHLKDFERHNCCALFLTSLISCALSIFQVAINDPSSSVQENTRGSREKNREEKPSVRTSLRLESQRDR